MKKTGRPRKTSQRELTIVVVFYRNYILKNYISLLKQ